MVKDLEKDPIWHLLNDLRREVQSINDKNDEHMISSTITQVKVEDLCDQVDQLNKLITKGNGNDSILTKIAKLEVNMIELRDDVKESKEYSKTLVTALLEEEHATETDVAKERWIAIGKVAGIIALAIPGILAFLDIIHF